jgi:hypothetical protein
MKRFILLLPLLLMTACASIPQGPAQGPAKASRVSVLIPGEGYSGDCFTGFFRPSHELTAKGNVAWIFIDPGVGTADIRFDNRYVQLTALSDASDQTGARYRRTYTAANPQLRVDLDSTIVSSEAGIDTLKGKLDVRSGKTRETIEVSGVSSCGDGE